MRKNSICSWLISVGLVMGFVLAGCGSSPAVSAQEAVAPKAADLTGVTSYYVRADGDDKNAGTSEAAPFKTLQRAVEAVAKTPVKKITVIGTLAGEKTVITDSGSDEILITGKPDSPDTEKAVLRPLPENTENYTIVRINGAAHIRLEHITVTGNGQAVRGIAVENKETILTIGQGAVITGCGVVLIRRGNALTQTAANPQDMGTCPTRLPLPPAAVLRRLPSPPLRVQTSRTDGQGGGAQPPSLRAPAGREAIHARRLYEQGGVC